MRVYKTLLLAGLILLPARMAAAAPPPPELGWIARLPGVMLIRSRTEPNTWIFHVNRTAATFNRIDAGLAARGWRVQRGSDLEDARGSIRGLIASSGAETVAIRIRNGPTRDGWMRLAVAYGSAALPPSLPTGVATTGYATMVNGDYIHRIVTAGGGSVVVNGHGNGVVVRGNCTVLTVNGTDNQVTVEGSVRRIEIGGHLNQVRWSAAANPTAPVVVRNGIDNDVIATP